MDLLRQMDDASECLLDDCGETMSLMLLDLSGELLVLVLAVGCLVEVTLEAHYAILVELLHLCQRQLERSDLLVHVRDWLTECMGQLWHWGETLEWSKRQIV